MKYLAYWKLLEEYGEGYKANEVIINFHEQSPLTFYYQLPFFGPDTSKMGLISNEVKDSFNNEIVSMLPTALQNNSLAVDLTDPEEGEMGGGGGVIPVPDLKFIIESGLVFMVAQTAAGFLQDIGSDLYKWIKKTIKGENVRATKANTRVLVKTTDDNIFTFIYYDYFDEETFNGAWKKMLRIEKYETLDQRDMGIFVYDSKLNAWKLVG